MLTEYGLKQIRSFLLREICKKIFVKERIGYITDNMNINNVNYEQLSEK